MSWEYDMGVLAWWIIPLAAGIFAALWATWSARTRTTGDNDSLAGYERFRAAMERSTEPPPKP
jgi:hypothetical protein